MPPYARSIESLEEFHRTRLDNLRKMIEAGVVAAIPAAKHYCLTHGIAVPVWLTEISIEFDCANLRGDKRKRRGRTANPMARYRQYACHYERWDAVKEIREKQEEVWIEIEKLRKLPKVPPHFLQEWERLGCSLGRTWADAYRCASERLAKTKSFGGVATMKSSYRLVERESRDPKKAMRYHLLDPQFLRKIS